ncbi:MAG: lytic transglycosylase domain-containing protein [Pseudomonadota bacterium]
MSTFSGFVIGTLLAAGLTALYGDKLQKALSESTSAVLPTATALDVIADAVPAMKEKAQDDGATSSDIAAQPAPAQTTKASETPTEAPPPVIRSQPDSVDQDKPSLEQLWEEYAETGQSLSPQGNFPWRACFARAAASYELPESLLLAIARGESNFDPAARSDKDAVGLMQIRWPGTSRHLGIVREADLYDPCTNVDAGARYLQELTATFDNNLHLAVAAYNYGPGAIAADAVPPGATWYSQYIYGHLQHVLGDAMAKAAPPRPSISNKADGQQVLMSFTGAQRARDFIAFMADEMPELRLKLNSNTEDHHEVVLLFDDENERQIALNAISASGMSPLILNSKDRFHL